MFASSSEQKRLTQEQLVFAAAIDLTYMGGMDRARPEESKPDGNGAHCGRAGRVAAQVT
jgi:hypothetical protein